MYFYFTSYKRVAFKIKYVYYIISELINRLHKITIHLKKTYLTTICKSRRFVRLRIEKRDRERMIDAMPQQRQSQSSANFRVGCFTNNSRIFFIIHFYLISIVLKRNFRF